MFPSEPSHFHLALYLLLDRKSLNLQPVLWVPLSVLHCGMNEVHGLS